MIQYYYTMWDQLTQENFRRNRLENAYTYSYDRNNCLLTTSKVLPDRTEVVSYHYDPNGNLVGEKHATYQPQGDEATIELNPSGPYARIYRYNSLGQMIRSVSEGRTIEYSYRPDGLRHRKGETLHLWDGQNIVADEQADERVLYLRGLNLIKREDSTKPSNYYLYNAHGDVVALADENGAPIWYYRYDAYGNEREVEGQDASTDRNPYRYCGEYHDTETGSVYLRARIYDPKIGRFRTEDPARSGMNWYTYCGNNPVMFIDPKGLSSILDRIAEGQKRKAADEALLDKYRTPSRKQQIANDKKAMENRDSGTPYSYKASKLDPWSLEQQQVRDAYSYKWSGEYVDVQFLAKVMYIANALEIKADWIMAVMASESRIRPGYSPYGTHAAGLIQFTGDAETLVGATVESLAQMTALEQLDYVYKFYLPYVGKMKNQLDVYVATAGPYTGALGVDDDRAILYTRGKDQEYNWNSGLDVDKDGYIRRNDLQWHMERMLKDYWSNWA